MHGLKWARIKVCRRCPHREARPGELWAACYGCLMDLRPTGHPYRDGAVGRYMDAAFWEGPDATCPAGKWAGLQPDETYSPQRAQRPRRTTADQEKGNQNSQQPPFLVSPEPSSFSAVSASSAVNCLFGSAAKCCARKVECRRHDGAVRVLMPSDCEACADKVERIRISAVVTALNEGDEVRKTVLSLAASIERPTTDLQIVVVDDGSTDGSCDALTASSDVLHQGEVMQALEKARATLILVRHDKPQGVGRARNAGWKLATGDVVSFHDCHMRMGHVFLADGRMVPEEAAFGSRSIGGRGGLERLALKALASRAVVSGANAGLVVRDGADVPAGNRAWGCDLLYDQANGLQAKWQTTGPSGIPDEEWKRVPCLMGASYVFSRATAQRLEDATGSLWEDTAGKWGFSEEALSVKAFLMDIPVLVSRDVMFRHRFAEGWPDRRKPGFDVGREKWRNIARATRVLFPPRLWEGKFGAACRQRLGAQLADIGGDHRPGWAVRDPREVFTVLCGREQQRKARHRDTEGTEGNRTRATAEHQDGQPSDPSVVVRPLPSVAVQPSSFSSSVSRAVVTVVLLNWRRPANIGPILDCLEKQTVPLQVYLWNNSALPLTFARDGEERPIAEHPLVKLYVQSSRNLGCFVRWELAALAETEFVCSLDDDLAFSDAEVLEDAIAAQREECPEGIIGLFGWTAGPPNTTYRDGRHERVVSSGSIAVDIVKGRFMLMRRDVLARVPLHVPGLDQDGGISHREDDIYVSLCVSGGKPGFHRLPARLARRWKELPEAASGGAIAASGYAVAASLEPGHYERRTEYVRAIRAWLNADGGMLQATGSRVQQEA